MGQYIVLDLNFFHWGYEQRPFDVLGHVHIWQMPKIQTIYHAMLY